MKCMIPSKTAGKIFYNILLSFIANRVKHGLDDLTGWFITERLTLYEDILLMAVLWERERGVSPLARCMTLLILFVFINSWDIKLLNFQMIQRWKEGAFMLDDRVRIPHHVDRAVWWDETKTWIWIGIVYSREWTLKSNLQRYGGAEPQLSSTQSIRANSVTWWIKSSMPKLN